MAITVSSGVTSTVDTNLSGTGSSFIVLKGGTVDVVAGGTTDDDVISSGGTENVSSGGSSLYATISGSASLVVSSGGVAIDTDVTSTNSDTYGLTVLSGGTAISATIGTNGNENVSAGGVDSGTVLSGAGANENMYGSAIGDVISAGNQYVEGGATATDTTVVAGGVQELEESSAIASGTIVSSGGSLYNYGTAVDATILGSGSETVGIGGTASANTISSGGVVVVSSGGSVSGDIISSGGVETISKGGTASADTVNNGGVLEVVSSGTVSGLTVNSGGTLELLKGARVSGTDTISSGGTLEVGSGFTVSNSTAIGGINGGVANGVTVEVLSSGTISALNVNSGGTLELLKGALVSGTDTISSGGTLQVGAGFTVSNTTAIGGVSGGVANGVTVEVLSSGTISGLNVNSGGTLELLKGALVSGTDTISSGGTVEVGSGFSAGNSTKIVGVSGGVANGVTVEVLSGGTASALSVNSGGTLDVQSGGIVSGGITFAGAGGTLKIDGSTLPTNLLGGAVVSGLVIGDTIDLTGIRYSTPSSVGIVGGDELQLTEGGNTYDLQVAGSFTGDYFHLGPDGGNGTDITESQTACYLRGTLIRAERGDIAVENLAIGENIMTASGALRPIRWIGWRSYGGRFIIGRKDILPICIKAGALDDNVPGRDLWVSPHHAMYLEGVLIEAKDLVNGTSIVQPDGIDLVEYFHIELETHDLIIAEGAPSETFIDDDSRFMFQNAHEYRRLYPEAATGVDRYCAPRREDGYEVEAARRHIALRAGLYAKDAGRPNELRGFVDLVSAESIEGWAQNTHHPEAPVCLDIYAGNKLIGQVLANRYREGLADFTLGSGRHSFAFAPPPGLNFAADTVEVRRSLDGAVLPLTKRAREDMAARAASPSQASTAA
jgi:O-antigen biosynthesis protein